ncbi:MAG: 50S ribosomal protein L9 [Syntrophobacterales bacterium]|nr:50S ribosomal protein L9 [Syntrophobacterales bacterium]
MNVILREDVESLGKIGDLIKVSNGYARNFLIPKGFAIEANPRNIKVLTHEKKTIEERSEKRRKHAESLREKLEGLTCPVYRKKGEQGKLFGSVTAKDIEKVLADQGIKIEKKNINLKEPIKTPGEFPVNVKIYSGITAEIKVVVIGE